MAGGGETSTTTFSCKKRKKKPQIIQQDLSPLISLVVSATSAAHSFLSQNDLRLHPYQTLTLESKISSSAISLTKIQSLLTSLNPPKPLNSLALLPPPPSLTPSVSSSPCWFQRFITAASNDSDPRWPDAFRMSKPSFSLLLETLTPSLQNSVSGIPPDYMLGAALFRLAHGASYKSVGRRFGIDSAGACHAFYEVCKAVNNQLGHLFEFPSDCSRILVGFGLLSLPNCCGVLGFSRFPVDGVGLGKDGAVVVQGLVDSEGRFLDVSVGWPNSMSPDTILRQTKLFLRVEELKELLNGPMYELCDGNSVPQYVLGDSCCPLLPWLLTPFERSSKDDSSSSMEQAFNAAHSRGMELIDTAFGRLRALWRLLAMRWKEECFESFPFVIVTGCLLYNFLIQCREKVHHQDGDYLKEQRLPVFEGKENESAEKIRNALALHLNRKEDGQVTSNSAIKRVFRAS